MGLRRGVVAAWACVLGCAPAPPPAAARAVPSPISVADAGSAVDDADADDSAARAAKGRAECERAAGATMVARAEQESISEDCYPAQPKDCKRFAPVYVVNCSQVTRVVGVREIGARGRVDVSYTFDNGTLAPSASTILTVPIRHDGTSRYRVSASSPDAPEQFATDLTVVVRDPARERARAQYCIDLGDAGAPDARVPPLAAGVAELELQRSSCYGSCPAYRVALRTDGTVVYQGDGFVRVVGNAIGHAPPGAVKAIVARFDAAPPRDPHSHCTEPPDSPRAHVTLVRGGKKTDLLGGPRCDLQREIAKEIDRVGGTERWVTGSDECAERGLW